jgi:hypothetical protein
LSFRRDGWMGGSPAEKKFKVERVIGNWAVSNTWESWTFH